MIGVTIESSESQDRPLLLDDCDYLEGTGLEIQRSLFTPNKNREATVIILNTSEFTERILKGAVVGTAVEVCSVCRQGNNDEDVSNVVEVRQVGGNEVMDAKIEERKRALLEVLGEFDLPSDERDQMLALLCEYHYVFALEDGECGETDLLQFEIDTGNAVPNRQHPRRMPFLVREEVAKQLKKMLGL